jgi:hypothetical protein
MKVENQNEFLGQLTENIKGHQLATVKTVVKVRPMLEAETK